MLKQRHMPRKQRRGWFQWRAPVDQVLYLFEIYSFYKLLKDDICYAARRIITQICGQNYF